MERRHTALPAADLPMDARLRAAIEHLSESIVLTDAEDRFVIANRAFRELNRNVAHVIQPGVKFEDYLRAGITAGNYPDAIGKEQEWLEARLAERRNPGNPVERQRSNGRWFLIDDRRLPDGSMIRFGTEITARKRAEAVSGERNRDLQLVMDTVPMMITRLDRDERFLFVNRAYCELMQRSAEDIVGRRIVEVISPEAYAQIKPALNRALSGDPGSVERIQHRSNGERVEIESRYIPAVDVGGRVTGLIAVHRDVTAERQARRSLAESEERFRQTFELAASGIAHVDLQGRFTRVNRSLCQILGHDAAELVGRTVWDFSHPEDREVTDAARRRMRTGEIESEHFEKRYLRKDGATVWVDLTVALVRDAGGKPEYEIAVFDDISDRMAADAALRAQTERLQIGQTAARMIIMDRDIPNDRLIWSDSPEWLRGPLPASGRYPLFKDQVHAEDRAQFVAARDAAIESNRGGSVKFRIVRTDGEVLWLLSHQRVFADASGKAVRMLAALLDITEQHRAEQALAASEARFRAIFERSSAGIAITDPSGVYLSVNAAFARFFGYSAEEIVGRMKVSDLRSADDAEGVALYQQLVAGEIGYFERDRPYRHKGGAHIWGRATVSAVHGPDGKASYIVAVFTDITDEMSARERVERMNAELEERVETRTAELREAMKELDAFTYSVSHDLRAPIGAVSGFAHLLRSAEAARLSEDGLRLLGFIEHNAERMTRLIEGLLRFSRLGRSDLRRTRVSMNELAGESLLDFVDVAARARINAGPMPDCEGDPALLSQVWSNLVGNALKYSRDASLPCIDIGWDASQGAYYVRDNGVGFDMAYAGKLFGVFERLHHESEFDGNGIGLAIAERIVRLHGGAIWADAVPGRGATFWFTVPAIGSGAAPGLRSSPDPSR